MNYVDLLKIYKRCRTVLEKNGKKKYNRPCEVLPDKSCIRRRHAVTVLFTRI